MNLDRKKRLGGNYWRSETMKKIVCTAAFVICWSLAGLMANQALASLSDGLMAHYPFDGNANDISGNNNHGIEFGNLVYKPGVIGLAASFDGETSYIRVPHDSSLNAHDQITISFWIKAHDITNMWSPILHKGGPYLTNHQNREYSVWFNYSQAIHSSTGVYITSPVNIFAFSCCATIGNWHHYAITINKKENLIKTYVDGKLNSLEHDPPSEFEKNNKDLLRLFAIPCG